MALIQWEENLSVGIKEIDEQHKKLVDLINALHTAMLERRAKEVIGDILKGLVDYIKIHFSKEEKYFDKFGYPEANAHKREHNNFVKKVDAFKQKSDEGNLTINLEVMGFLKEWLVKHIKGTDKKYTSFFIDKGLN